MNIDEVIDKKLRAELNDSIVIGLDLGSRSAKAVLLADGNLFTAILPTGIFMQETADELVATLLIASGLKQSDISYIVGTGYGRIALEFEGIENQIVTEISCHAMGAHYLHAGTRTIVDIGGQDSKAIKVDPATGKVVEFIMNDKCAAGTGRFLEKVALLLDLSIYEIGEEALKAGKSAAISSQCVVFAESEVISLKAKGVKREEIAAGIHYATARRVKNLINRIGIEPDLVFTGGVSNNAGMTHAVEELLGIPLSKPDFDMVYAGALGAAVYAQKNAALSYAQAS